MADVVVVGGETFEVVDAREMSLAQRLECTSQLRAARLRPMDVYAAMGELEQGVQVMADLYDTGHAFTLLAAILRWKGQRWSKAEMPATVARFEEATGDEAEALARVLAEMVPALFVSGQSSMPTSPSSSARAATVSPPERTSARRARTTASGTRSSARSPTTTRTASSPSPRDGPAARPSARTARSSGPKPGSPTATRS